MASTATNEIKAKENDRRTKAYRLLETLYNIAMDTNESTQSRVSAAKTYLAKTLPDLKAIDHSGDIEVNAHHFIFRKPDRG